MTAPATAYEVLRRSAAERIEELKLDLTADAEDVRLAVNELVDNYQRRAHAGGGVRPLRDPDELLARLINSLSGYGPLTSLLERRDIEEIFIEGERVTFIDSSGRLQALNAPTSEEENRQIVARILSGTNRRLDTSNPIEQARVLDGTARLTAVIPPVADHLSVTIRKYTVKDYDLQFLVDGDALSQPAAAFLWAAAQATTTMMFSGPPGAGKTTLLSAFLRAAPNDKCIRVCEEVRELHVPLLHGSFYEASPPTLEGTRRYSLRDLVKVVLAQRPDLICVGEVRGGEAFELTRAVNAGCGFACTIHANSARDALSALVNAAIMAGENVTESIVRRVFASSIDFVIHLDRDMRPNKQEGIRRRVTEILNIAPALSADEFTTEPLFVREGLDGPLRWTGNTSATRYHGTYRAIATGRRGAKDDHVRRMAATQVRLLAPLFVGVTVYLAVGFATGYAPELKLRRPTRPQVSDRQLWLIQAGSDLTPQQFLAGSTAVGLVMFLAALLLTGAWWLALAPGISAFLVPRSYYGRRRTERLGGVRQAWPDGLRDMLASISAGSTMVNSLVILADHGPGAAAEGLRSFLSPLPHDGRGPCTRVDHGRARRLNFGQGDRGSDSCLPTWWGPHYGGATGSGGRDHRGSATGGGDSN